MSIAGRTVDETVAQTKRAAEAGFGSVWLPNIFGIDAITTLALAGREVPEVRLGTAVVPIQPRHPHALAQQAMTAWDATDGRFVLGIGLSHQIVIESMFGLSFDRPAAQMREYLAVLLALLRQGGVSFDGEYYKVNAQLDRAGSSEGPSVLLAALAPVMLRLAGQVADGTILWMTGARTIGEHIAPRITRAATEAGRPAPEIVCVLPVAVTDDVEGLRGEAGSMFSVYGDLPSYRAMLDHEGAAGPQDVAMVGNEETVAAAIGSIRDAGATEFSAACFGDSDTMRRTTKLLRELAS